MTNESFDRYYAFKGRFASLVGMSAAPLVASNSRWLILAVALAACALTLAFESPGHRVRVGLLCAAGWLVSVIIAALSSSFVIRMMVWAVTVMVIGALLYEVPLREKPAAQHPVNTAGGATQREQATDSDSERN